ncbi:MAG: hypothetical protein Q4A47_02910 [Erysipelotrichaceae bacterium]|nr:hypothetical protein [Erysipelotrichaceae bacterium]
MKKLVLILVVLFLAGCSSFNAQDVMNKALKNLYVAKSVTVELETKVDVGNGIEMAATGILKHNLEDRDFSGSLTFLFMSYEVLYKDGYLYTYDSTSKVKQKVNYEENYDIYEALNFENFNFNLKNYFKNIKTSKKGGNYIISADLNVDSVIKEYEKYEQNNNSSSMDYGIKAKNTRFKFIVGPDFQLRSIEFDFNISGGEGYTGNMLERIKFKGSLTFSDINNTKVQLPHDVDEYVEEDIFKDALEINTEMNSNGVELNQ